MEPDDFYSRNRVPILLIILALAVFGIISLFYLDFSLIPEIEYPELIVITSYPNAPPEEVKNIVTIPMEQIALSLKGVKNINTLSKDGMSIVKVRYQWGENLSTAHIELRERMDLIKSSFPKEVKRPIIVHPRASSDAVAGISVISNSIDDRSLFLLCRKDIKAFIEHIQGVSNVSVQGGEKPEVSVQVNPDKLVKYNVSISEIKNILGNSNKNYPVGFFNDENNEYLVRVNGEITDYKDLGDIVIKEENKRLVYLKDIALIEYGTQEKESEVLVDGENALMLSIHKRPAANIIKVSRNINNAVEQLNERYGGSIRFHMVFDKSTYIKNSLKAIIIALFLGVIFTIFSVYIFLGNLRISLLIILTIPLSIVSTFIIMKLSGISINLLTLGGFSLAIGMLVDNSVIVVTRVAGLLHGEKYQKEFYQRVKSVIPAVVSATFTTVVVFFPVLFLSGIMKLIFMQLALVIVISLLFSLIISVTLIPVQLSRTCFKEKMSVKPTGCSKIMGAGYGRVLSFVLKKKVLFSVGLCTVIILGGFSYSGIEKCFIESVPQNYFFVNIFIKQQVPYEYTYRLTRYVSEIIKRHPGVTTIIASVGVDKKDVLLNLDGLYGSNTAVLKVYTDTKGNGIYGIIHSLRNDLRIFSGVDILIAIPDNPVQRLVSRSDFDVVVKAYNPSPLEPAGKLGEIDSFIRDHEITDDVLSSQYQVGSERSFILKRDELPIFNVSAVALSDFISSAITGLRVGTWKRDEYEIPINMRFQRDSFSTVKDLLNLSIKNNEGRKIKLAEILALKEVSSPPAILRENQRSYVKIEFNIRDAKKRSLLHYSADDTKSQIEGYLSSAGLDYEYIDQFTMLRENYKELLLALFLAVFLEYIILATVFKSLSKPALVILMIPLSIPGIILILYLLNSSLNINTFMSVIVLIGLMVNNAIMLFLEYRNKNIKTEKGLISASVKRLKPILITTFSTVLALIPALFTGNKLQVTLAATLIFGLLYSTTVTLFYLPMFYALAYMHQGRRKR